MKKIKKIKVTKVIPEVLNLPSLLKITHNDKQEEMAVEAMSAALTSARERYMEAEVEYIKSKRIWRELVGISNRKKSEKLEDKKAKLFFQYLKKLQGFWDNVINITKKDKNLSKSSQIKAIWRIALLEELERLEYQRKENSFKGPTGIIKKGMSDWSNIPLSVKLILSLILFLLVLFLKKGSITATIPYHAILNAWGVIILLEGIQQSILKYFLSYNAPTYKKIMLEAQRKYPKTFPRLKEKLEESLNEYWEKIKLASEAKRKYLTGIYIVSGILGSLLTALPYLPNNLRHYVNLSMIDFVTRYIWFLVPYAFIHKGIANFFRKHENSKLTDLPPKESWFIKNKETHEEMTQRKYITRDKKLAEILDRMK